MNRHPHSAQTDGTARRTALRDLSRLLAIVGKPRWATPALIVVGLLSSIAETLGITLVLLFLYSATGQHDMAGGGMTQQALDRATTFFGSDIVLASVIMALIIARGLLAMLNGRIGAGVGEHISRRTRDLIHRQYLTLTYGHVQSYDQGTLIQVLGSDSYQVANVYAAWTRIIVNCCSIAVFGAMLLAISWKVTLVAAIGAGLVAALSRRLSKPAQVLGDRVRGTHQRLGEHMLLTLQGMRTIRAFGQEAVHQQRFERASSESKDVSIALVRLSGWLSPLTEVGYLLVLCVIIAGGQFWGLGFALTLGAVALLYRLQPHTRELEGNLLYIAQTQPQLRSVLDMIRRDDKPYQTDGERPLPRVAARIAFDKVCFRYDADSAPVLDGVSFTIPAGGTTALIGASGAGKTTIVNLLLRLYEPDSGTIRVDGQPLNDIRRADWLSMLAVAGQDVDLVEGTVIDNIRMAAAGASDKQVLAAAADAGVADFVAPLTHGYDTWIGQEGLRFSGGQRQRIGLARALVRQSEILILDEAMSALDRGLEDRVRAAISRHAHDRTMLVITHRLETVRDAAHVVWIENGRLMMEGTPEHVLPHAARTLDPTATINAPMHDVDSLLA